MARVTIHTDGKARAASAAASEMTAEERLAAVDARALAEADASDVVEDENVHRVGEVTIRLLDKAKGRIEVIDRLGRKLVAQKLSELERFDLFEVFGSTSPNAYTIGMSSVAATLRSIETAEGERINRAFPKNIQHIRGAIAALGDAGMDALRTAFAPPERAGEDEPSADDDGSLALAKN